jgi:flagellar hook-associated protein 3 FlgL
MGYDQINRNLQKNRSDMNELQNQAATQKRINKPSDDPVASARILTARSEDRGYIQFQKNINSAKSFLEFSDQSLSELNDILIRLKELAIQQASDAGASADTRRVVAREVEQAFHQAIQIGNRKLGERYIFGGYRTTEPPFTPRGDYLGDDGDLRIHVNKDTFMPMNVTGERVFLGKGFGKDGYFKPAVQQPRTAEELHEYRSKQMEQDTQKELEQRRDLPISRALASTVALESMGTSTQSRLRAGAPPVVVEKDLDLESGVNILQTIKNFETALQVNDKEQIQESIDALDQAISQVITNRALVGARIQSLDGTLDSIQKALVENKSFTSSIEDVDLFQLVSDINKADTALKATLETSGRVTQSSLLDFLKR